MFEVACSHQVIDYTSDPDAEDTNVRIDFPGTKLNNWLESPAGQRTLGEDGKPIGVRWSESSLLHLS